MALLHEATLSPSKAELANPWLVAQPWYSGVPASELTFAGSFRLDDPEGEVGIETMLLRSDDVMWQLPLTYRAAPFSGGEASLIGTLEHSVLGTRYVYDAVGDPVYRAVVRATIAEGGHEAELVRQRRDGVRESLTPTMSVRGTGYEGDTDRAELLVDRQPEAATAEALAEASGVLLGMLPGVEPLVLARLHN